jgi:hypothetical protein
MVLGPLQAVEAQLAELAGKTPSTSPDRQQQSANLQVLCRSPLTDSNRPLLTVERLKQPVATDRNGFGLFLPLLRSGGLPLTATGCNHGAP